MGPAASYSRRQERKAREAVALVESMLERWKREDDAKLEGASLLMKVDASVTRVMPWVQVLQAEQERSHREWVRSLVEKAS